MPDPILKTAASEIETILAKHDIAGIVILSSKTHLEYVMGISPTWSCCTFEDLPEGKALRLRAKKADYPSKEAWQTAIRDSVGLIAGLYDATGSMHAQLGRVAAKIGAQIPFTNITRDDNPGRS